MMPIPPPTPAGQTPKPIAAKGPSWFSKLFSASDEVSLKRVIGLACFIILCYDGIYCLHSKIGILNVETNKYFMEVLFMIICVTLLGGSIENIFKARFASQNVDTAIQQQAPIVDTPASNVVAEPCADNAPPPSKL